MPLYDYECSCGKSKNDEFVFRQDDVVTCECGKNMKRKFPTSLGGNIFPQDGLVLENVASYPIKVNSYREAKELQKKHNVQLGCVL